MPDSCFCALGLVSSNPTRIPPSYTYLGYECDGSVVTASAALQEPAFFV